MRSLTLPVAAGIGLGALVITSTVRAEAPSFAEHVAAWADTAGYRLTPIEGCSDATEAKFGGAVGSCFAAKRRKKSGDLYPRMVITEATYGSDEKAKERVSKLREAPPGEDVDDEGHKSYPLRAAFRVGEKVVVVTTDAFAFRPDIDRAAVELAKETGGTDVTCWKTCPKP